MNKKATVVLSIWMGILTVLSIFYFVTSYDASSQPVKRLLTKELLPLYDDTVEPREDFAESMQPHLEKYREMLSRTLNAPHRKNSRVDFHHVILLSNFLPRITNITRISTPSNEMFLKIIAPYGLPVIFTDMLVGTPLEKWSWNTIKNRWGGHMFHNTRQGFYSTRANKLGKHYVNRVSVHLSDFVDIVTGVREPTELEKGLYITKQKLLPPNALDGEFYYPPFYSSRKHRECFLEPTGWYVKIINNSHSC